MRWLMVICLVVTASAALAAGDIPATVVLVSPRAVDGDTLRTRWMRWRLWGIAAPERGEPGGPEATKALRALVPGRTLFCTVRGRPSHGRPVIRCRIGSPDGPDVGRLLVERGVVRDCARHSGGAYAPFEAPAARRLPLPPYCRSSGQ